MKEIAQSSGVSTIGATSAVRGLVYECCQNGAGVSLDANETRILWESMLADTQKRLAATSELQELKHRLAEVVRQLGPIRVPDGELAGRLVEALESATLGV